MYNDELEYEFLRYFVQVWFEQLNFQVPSGHSCNKVQHAHVEYERPTMKPNNTVSSYTH